MDQTEDDIKFAGFFNIFNQSFKTIFSWKKIFAQMTLAFILPLTIIFLIQMSMSYHFFWKIDNNTIPYHTSDSRETTATEWLYYTLFTIAYFILLTVFSILATAAVVFTIASIYTGSEALKKGKYLANRKKKVGMRIAFVLYVFLVGLNVVYILFVEYGHEVYILALMWRVMIGILCGILLLMLFLVFIVTQTVLYLVCKSYHREAIDQLCLSTFLGAYMGETVVYPRSGEKIQLGRSQSPPEQVLAVKMKGLKHCWIVPFAFVVVLLIVVMSFTVLVE
ncbi:hypothetical protein L1987_79767 [Smallanthus sonchifolius]|uniref:Uncharacterized protein n=1 Tax=Smallanthus sonchifolius TaxID=185202 RepID=A0ACB8YLG3_9ASTR|nr:hypothetical protein L1987_79767 [Smallanthus sonchifolius]